MHKSTSRCESSRKTVLEKKHTGDTMAQGACVLILIRRFIRLKTSVTGQKRERTSSNMSRSSARIIELIGGAALLMALLTITGCGGAGGRVFPEENLVASGFEIDWVAKEKGMAFLVEEKRNRVLKTQALEKNEKFSFSVSGIDSALQFQAIFGVKFSQADFNLYFLPEGQEFKK